MAEINYSVLRGARAPELPQTHDNPFYFEVKMPWDVQGSAKAGLEAKILDERAQVRNGSLGQVLKKILSTTP